MCEKCGAYAHQSLRDLAVPCRPSKGDRSRRRRKDRFLQGRFPDLEGDWTISRPFPPTPLATSWLVGRLARAGKAPWLPGVRQPPAPAPPPASHGAASPALAAVGLTYEQAVAEGKKDYDDWVTDLM